MIVDESATYERQARARLWNLMLGGPDSYENDQWLLDELNAIVPWFAMLARNEVDFVDRFWRFAAGRGVKQVVYLGAPLPAGLPPHGRLPDPGRVVYVEGDELLYRKGLAWMTARDVDVVRADPLNVEAVVDAIGGRIDWLEPVAVIAPSVLPWTDDRRARTWAKQVVEELKPGSLLATTHLCDPENEASVVPIERLLLLSLDDRIGAGFFRRRSEIEGLFSGLPLEKPGVTFAVDWFPNGPRLCGRDLVDDLLAVAVVTVPASP
jgi:hypothetical protein